MGYPIAGQPEVLHERMGSDPSLHLCPRVTRTGLRRIDVDGGVPRILAISSENGIDGRGHAAREERRNPNAPQKGNRLPVAAAHRCVLAQVFDGIRCQHGGEADENRQQDRSQIGMEGQTEALLERIMHEPSEGQRPGLFR